LISLHEIKFIFCGYKFLSCEKSEGKQKNKWSKNVRITQDYILHYPMQF